MILARVRRTLLERELVTRGDRVVVACSGGPDSAALLHALARLAPALELTLTAASIDHGLRADAPEDVALARALADRLAIPFAGLRVAIAPGGSIHARARAARYAVLREEAARVGATKVAVGHTKDDQAETVLARLLRGAGVRGLAGIAPRREDGVIRPLLDCDRGDVHAYVAHHDLPHRRDPSNDDPAFERARIRSAVVPALAAEDPRLTEHLADLADDARDLRELIDEAAACLLGDDLSAAVDAHRLCVAPRPVRRAALARWVRYLTSCPPRRVHIEALERLIATRSGEALIGGGWVVRGGATLVAREERSHPTRSNRPARANQGLRSPRKASDH